MDASKYIEAKYLPPPSKKYVWTRGGDGGDGLGDKSSPHPTHAYVRPNPTFYVDVEKVSTRSWEQSVITWNLNGTHSPDTGDSSKRRKYDQLH